MPRPQYETFWQLLIEKLINLQSEVTFNGYCSIWLSSLLPTKFSQLPSLHTFITSSLFNVLIVLALHPSLLLLGHLHHPLLKLLITPFSMLHRVSDINSLYLFVNLILVPVPPSPTHLFCHPSLIYLFIYLYKLITSNSTPVVSLLPPGLPSRTFACIVSFELIGFVFSFSWIFVSVPCARLSWPFRQLLSARKYIVSYHIVFEFQNGCCLAEILK